MKLSRVLIYSAIVLTFACNGNKTVPVEAEDVVITGFPAKKELKATIIQTSPVILDPNFMFIMNNQIWIFQPRKDTLFDVFNLPDCSYLCGVGTRGQGPDEFIYPQAQTIQVENNRFIVYDRNVMKTAEMQSPKLLRVVKKEKVFDIYPVNGFAKLNDSLFCMFADFFLGIEGDIEFEFLLKNTYSGEEIKFSKYPEYLTTRKYLGDEKCKIYIKSPVANASKGKFATFYNFFKFFRIYSINETVKLEKEVHVNIEPFGTDNLDNWEKRDVYYGKPFGTEKYIYAPCSNEIQVWDWDGNPVMQYFLDITPCCFAVSEELKKLYVLKWMEKEENEDESIDKIYVYDLVHL
jgi:hypothetical protein